MGQAGEAAWRAEAEGEGGFDRLRLTPAIDAPRWTRDELYDEP